MKKTLEQRIAAAELELARLSHEKKELARRETAKRRLALGARVEAAGGDWLASLDPDALRALLTAAKRHHDTRSGAAS